jgi:protein ImuA
MSRNLLPTLRERIRRIERPAAAVHGVLPFGVAAIDRTLPGGGLARGAVHELLGMGGDEEDGALAAAFAAGILARLGSPTSPSHPHPPLPRERGRVGEGAGPSLSPLKGGEGNKARQLSLSALGGGEGRGEVGAIGAMRDGIVLWCLPRPDLYGPGLAVLGLDPARLVLVRARRDAEILWAIEEGLRAAGVAAVVGELGMFPAVASRRLQLAAERSGVTAFVLRRWRDSARAARERNLPNAAATRWRITALPSVPARAEPGIGRPRWRVELLRCRGGEAACWEVEGADATGSLSLVSTVADRPDAPLKGSAIENGAFRSEKFRGEKFRRTG